MSIWLFSGAEHVVVKVVPKTEARTLRRTSFAVCSVHGASYPAAIALAPTPLLIKDKLAPRVRHESLALQVDAKLKQVAGGPGRQAEGGRAAAEKDPNGFCIVYLVESSFD